MVVIVGAGITGVATAYYLLSKTQHQPSNFPVTIIDAVGPAACSSGKAGAFVSQAWGTDNGSSNIKRDALFRAAYPLHEQLAHELNLQSFRELPAFRVDIEKESKTDEVLEDWRSEESNSNTLIPGPSALVNPAELTRALFDAALERGATFRKGTVDGLETSEEGSRVTSISFEDGTSLEIEEKEEVVIALGPWSSRIEDWLDIPLPIDGVLSTSLLWEQLPEHNVTAALFCKDDSNGCHLEIFPRSGQSLYVSGCGGSEVISPEVFRGLNRPHPEETCAPNLARAAAARSSLESPSLRPMLPETITRRPPDVVQACIRPAAPDGVPILGKLPTVENVYVATGGGPWGITWGPLMGLCVASMILDDEEPPIRLAPYKPDRFDTLIYRTLLKQRGSIDRVT
jgi:glycine/D-amino acid oxidase-like deaminating enzyme